jgi:molybdopterin-containing oxidoreductase family iron-sulfur binding subunit
MSSLERMRLDLRRALQKPMARRRWVMVIDTRKCIGCNACTVACQAENATPPGVNYRLVPEVEAGEYPDVTRFFMPTQCMQCENPPCQKAAPAGAITRRPDGIVVINYAKLRGKQAFEAVSQACPYTALSYDEGKTYTGDLPGGEQAYEQRASFDYGQTWEKDGKSPPVGSARKCHFCLHRLTAGMLPACVTTCVGAAMYFGDLNDKKSLVSELLATQPARRINEDLGTRPRVYYLVSVRAENMPMAGVTCQACHQ